MTSHSNVRTSQATSLWQQWRRDLKSALERDPAARSALEVLLIYPGVHAILVHRLNHRLWHGGFRFAARFCAFLMRMITNVDIHPGAQIGESCFIDHGAGVVIGETAVLGNNVTLYHGVTLGGTSWKKGKRHPTLGDGVMVGAGAKILGPIVIGRQCRVGANSVVVSDVPDACTVVGIPGKVVKVRPAGQQNPYGFDLDHHLIPDPVGKVMGCLLERIERLETEVALARNQSPARADEIIASCQPDNEICEQKCIGSL
ncbi:serine O-acetyltransferase [Gynuella sunshinyii]|uniref:Serine acetyltransferase n=1 Tax=Gynuella sunshinyii YC6258 TaxID=1445510 RepID=A0A0C5VIG4_9GAMM|nr:serine O-acetyltransferase [Gynuella sunshinyii]AJQ94056.1 serine acetyltransferase [Gynuella sunshinyii YC6258]